MSFLRQLKMQDDGELLNLLVNVHAYFLSHYERRFEL